MLAHTAQLQPGGARAESKVISGSMRKRSGTPGPAYYSFVPDVAAGGRLAFDHEGFLYISVGVKGSSNFDGVQDLTKPWGKIHRVHDDGRIPGDNPFIGQKRRLSNYLDVRAPQSPRARIQHRHEHHLVDRDGAPEAVMN